jgi:hypothetical protein
MKSASTKAVLVLATTAVMLSPAMAAITTESLLSEMTDLKRLATLPEPPYITKQFSSWDRASKSHSDFQGWFANGDAGQYLRVEDKDGRKEFVMMDIDGPGAIVRIWSANPEGTLRVYVDNADKPAVEADMKKFTGGDVPGFPKPIASEASRGWNNYFPIPYAKHCKVTSDKGGFYYHVNYRTWPAGTEVKSFMPDDPIRLADKIKDVAERLADPRKGGGPPAERTKTPFDVKVGPNAEAVLCEMDGPKAVCGFLVHLDAADLDAAARQVVLYMSFHGDKIEEKSGKPSLEQTVETPIGDFFGTAPGLTPYDSLPLGITKDKPQDLWCHWWMPFNKKALIKVRNLGEQEVRVSGAVAVMPWEWSDKSLLFHAKWRIEKHLPSRPMTDWVHMACSGKGRFVGGALHVINPVKNWWGEGDEKIYVDGEVFPSHLGTGTEDYYGYAWCCNERFVHAYHNQPRCDGPGNFGNTSVNRWHIMDDIPFNKSFKFDIENWHSHPACDTTRAAISYWYARPGCWDEWFFGPITRDQVKIEPMPVLEVSQVPGAIEGEKMKVVEKTGEVSTQELGGWSSDAHLWWTQGKPGDKITLGLPTREAGSKHVVVRLTKAVDYGQVQLYVNGKKAGEVIDLFQPEGVGRTEALDLGAFDLAKGRNLLTVEIVGANDKAVKAYMFGLDYILLK